MGGVPPCPQQRAPPSALRGKRYFARVETGTLPAAPCDVASRVQRRQWSAGSPCRPGCRGRRCSAPERIRRSVFGEEAEGDGFGEGGFLEVAEVLGFVGAVNAAGGIADGGEHDVGRGEGFGEGGDEGDRAADPDLDGGLAPGFFEGGPRGGVAATAGLEREGRGRGAFGEGEASAPGDVCLDVLANGRHGAGGVVAGGDADAELGTRDRDDLVDRFAHGGCVDGEDRDGGAGPGAAGEGAGADQVEAVDGAGL